MTTHLPDNITILGEVDGRVALAWGGRVVLVNPAGHVMACRLKDFSGESAESRAAYKDMQRNAPSDDTWKTDTCSFCEQEVLIGPRQQAFYGMDPEAFVLACMLCGGFYAHWVNSQGGGDGTVPLAHLGGA